MPGRRQRRWRRDVAPGARRDARGANGACQRARQPGQIRLTGKIQIEFDRISKTVQQQKCVPEKSLQLLLKGIFEFEYEILRNT